MEANSDVIREIFWIKVKYELKLICSDSYVSERKDWKGDWRSQILKVLKSKLFSFSLKKNFFCGCAESQLWPFVVVCRLSLGGLLKDEVPRLLSGVSLVSEHGLQATWVQQFCHRDLTAPRHGHLLGQWIESMSSALVGEFLITGLPGKPPKLFSIDSILDSRFLSRNQTQNYN